MTCEEQSGWPGCTVINRQVHPLVVLPVVSPHRVMMLAHLPQEWPPSLSASKHYPRRSGEIIGKGRPDFLKSFPLIHPKDPTQRSGKST